VDLKKIPHYQEYVYDAKVGLKIGAAVTYTQLIEDKKIRKDFPLLVEAASQVGSLQLRNRATPAGNLCTASPAGDMCRALVCYDAQVVLASEKGKRTLPVSQFLKGVKRTDLQAGEVLEGIIIPPEYKGCKGMDLKLKRIKGHDLAQVGVSGLKTKNGKIRICAGAVAPMPILVEVDSQNKNGLKKLLDELKEKMSPISDVRASSEYREFMSLKYAERIWNKLAD
jgi:CO/xanthine dehydrogenase FAD-binding subunit